MGLEMSIPEKAPAATKEEIKQQLARIFGTQMNESVVIAMKAVLRSYKLTKLENRRAAGDRSPTPRRKTRHVDE